jgi:hypothetical protein
MAPLRPKGLVDPILNIRFTCGLERVDRFLGGHPNLNGGHPGLLEKIAEGILGVKGHPTSFGPKEVENETSKNVQWLFNVGEATSVVALNIGRVILSFKNEFA